MVDWAEKADAMRDLVQREGEKAFAEYQGDWQKKKKEYFDKFSEEGLLNGMADSVATWAAANPEVAARLEK